MTKVSKEMRAWAVAELDRRIRFKNALHKRCNSTAVNHENSPNLLPVECLEKHQDMYQMMTKDALASFDLSGEFVDKAVKYLYENDEAKGELKRAFVGNTYNWMDSYGDVHLNNTFARSLNGRGKTAPHLRDHKFETDFEVGEPIKIEERSLSWRELGAAKTGKTQALVVESIIKRSMHERTYERYLAGKANQHSVCMQYVSIELASDDEEEYPKEFALWKEVLPLLGNRKEAEAQGFFFVVREAKLIEVSVVLMGANELTPTLGAKPSSDTSTTEEEDQEKTRPKDTRILSELYDLKKTILLEEIKRF